MKHLKVLTLAAVLIASTTGCQCLRNWFCCKGAPACPPPVAPPVTCGVPVDGCATGQGAVLVQQ